jgi:hypothetical protein
MTGWEDLNTRKYCLFAQNSTHGVSDNPILVSIPTICQDLVELLITCPRLMSELG